MDDGDQLPPLDLPRPMEDQPDLNIESPPMPQPIGLAATNESSPQQIYGATDEVPLDAAPATGEIGLIVATDIEIESSDLIFDLEEATPVKDSDETGILGSASADVNSDASEASAFYAISQEEDGAGTADYDDSSAISLEGQQSDSIAVPMQDAEEPPASAAAEVSAVENIENSLAPIQIEFEPIDEDALSKVPITIELPDEPVESPFPALEQDTGVSDIIAASEKRDAEKLAVTEEPEFDAGDVLDSTVSFYDDEDTGAFSVSPGKAENEYAPEEPGVPIMAQQQEQSSSAGTEVGDVANLSSQEILATMSSSMSASESSEPEAAPQSEIAPITDFVGEGQPAPAGSLPDQAPDSVENAYEYESEAELSAVAAALPSDAPAPEAQMPLAEPPPQATNANAKIKIRMGEDLIENLTIEDVAAMVEHRQLLEDHFIARQFSENWIAAPLVPTLRPIFEKLRAEDVQLEAPPPPNIQAGKRGLFNGLFGRN
jgi:hypothetical protein